MQRCSIPAAKSIPAACLHVSVMRQEVYEVEKEKILIAERRVLHALEFIFNVEHPYKHVLLIVKKNADNNKEIAQVAWNFINDRYLKRKLVWGRKLQDLVLT